MNKVWSQDQRNDALIRIIGRYKGVRDIDAAIDLQCELTEATQLLNDYIHKGCIDGPAVTEFLKRHEGR